MSESLVARFAGPDELIGSGHPSGDSALPTALGLIRSSDAGKTWESVSELGTSDFHALARSGDVLVAPLYGQAQMLLSRDDGKTFEPRVAPMALVDLAVDPGDPGAGPRPRSRASSSRSTRAARGASATRRRTCVSPGATRTSSTGSTRAGR